MDGFVTLSPSAYAKARPISNSDALSCHPPASAAAKDSPDLIILTSWTGALPKHIKKYTQVYQSLYPESGILLVTTSIKDLTVRNSKKKLAALEPAVHYIETQVLSRRTPQYNILLHAFSEGGSNKAVCLAQAFLDRTGYRLPIAAYIYDSTPGTARFSNNLAAYKRSLPLNPIVRSLGIFLGLFILSATFFFHRVLMRGKNDVFEKTRRAINDATLWPVVGVARTYLFSEADDLIWWRDILDHAEMSARQFGVLSLVVKYEHTTHCNHMRDNEQHYWHVVKRTWESRTGVQPSSLADLGYTMGLMGV